MMNYHQATAPRRFSGECQRCHQLIPVPGDFFTYQAIRHDGTDAFGVLEAESDAEASSKVEKMGLTSASIRRVAGPGSPLRSDRPANDGDSLFPLLERLDNLRARNPQTRKMCLACTATYFVLTIPAVRDELEQRGPEVLLLDLPGGHTGFLVPKHLSRSLTELGWLFQDIQWADVVQNWSLPWPEGTAPAA